MAPSDPRESNGSGLEVVFMDHRAALLRFLRARGGEDADDLLQELWMKVADSKAGPITDPLSYLYRMADNLVVDRHRSAQRRMRREDEWHEVVPGMAGGMSGTPTAERIVMARQRLREVETMLMGLGERTATIFLRFRSDGVGQREIAQEQGISLSAVEKHLQRAYRALTQMGSDAEVEVRHRPDIERAGDVAE